MTTTARRDASLAAKRQATAHALAQAAFDLAHERGLDGFTIDEVTARAGYSRRTFANHFSGKEEAVVAIAAEQVRSTLSAPPDDGVPLLDWLRDIAGRQLSGGLLDILRELQQMARSNPALQPHLLDVQRQIRESARDAVSTHYAGRVGRVYADLLVGAAYGALTCALDGWIPLRDRPTEEVPSVPTDTLSLPEFIETAFSYLRTGF